MCELITDLLTDCQPVVGGMLPELYITYQNDVDIIPAVTVGTSTIATAITMKAGKYVRKFELMDNETASLEITGIGERSAMGLNAKILVKIPSVSPDRLHLIKNMVNGRFILFAKDKAGNTWMMGDLKIPANMKLTKASFGAKAADPNHFEIEFSSDSPVGVYNYTSTIPID
jgi:DNA-directed RNA polymerase subunit F